MTVYKNLWTFLDTKQCFDLWRELTSLRLVQLKLIEQGVVNPYTNKPPTRMGIRAAAYRWISENLDEARKILVADGNHLLAEDVYWKAWLKTNLRSSLTPRQYKEFVKEHGLDGA